jgi:hypothetical protein
MDGQQRILDGVFHIGGIPQPRPADRKQQRQALPQQSVVGA